MDGLVLRHSHSAQTKLSVRSAARRAVDIVTVMENDDRLIGCAAIMDHDTTRRGGLSSGAARHDAGRDGGPGRGGAGIAHFHAQPACVTLHTRRRLRVDHQRAAPCWALTFAVTSCSQLVTTLIAGLTSFASFRKTNRLPSGAMSYGRELAFDS